MIRVADIKQAVAEHYDVPVEVMNHPWQGGRERLPIARPRQAAMCLSYRLTRHKYTRIGQMFGGRDRTTVRHAVEASSARDTVALRQITMRLLVPTGLAA